MKAYLAITGLTFLLIFGAHVARVATEGGHLLREPMFTGTSLLSLGMAAWAGWLLRSRRG